MNGNPKFATNFVLLQGVAIMQSLTFKVVSDSKVKSEKLIFHLKIIVLQPCLPKYFMICSMCR